jgi:hypothetical protein
MALTDPGFAEADRLLDAALATLEEDPDAPPDLDGSLESLRAFLQFGLRKNPRLFIDLERFAGHFALAALRQGCQPFDSWGWMTDVTGWDADRLRRILSLVAALEAERCRAESRAYISGRPGWEGSVIPDGREDLGELRRLAFGDNG